MNDFDSSLIHLFNRFSRSSELFDELVTLLADSALLKGGVLALIIVWVWFKSDDPRSAARKHVLWTLGACVITMAVARTLSNFLPFRPRPLHADFLHFVVPVGENPKVLDDASSFPSDHAALFFSLATGLLFASRRCGIVALVYSTVFIMLPRIYLGLHYPTDILAGGALGIVVAVVTNRLGARSTRMDPLLDFSCLRPELFYPVFFFATYQIADMFDQARMIVGELVHILAGGS